VSSGRHSGFDCKSSVTKLARFLGLCFGRSDSCQSPLTVEANTYDMLAAQVASPHSQTWWLLERDIVGARSLAIWPNCPVTNHRAGRPMNGTEAKPFYSNSEPFPKSFTGADAGVVRGSRLAGFNSPREVHRWREVGAL